MPLAVFALVIHRYRPSRLVIAPYESYPQLAEYLPKDQFDSHMLTLRQLVRKEYPNIYPDTYMFMSAIGFVIATAAFSIVARGLEISMWYPLLILVAPAILAYWTTRRRSIHYIKINNFQEHLQQCLKDLSELDRPHQVRWDYRRLRDYDTARDLHLPPPLNNWSISLVIEAVQIDPEAEVIARGMTGGDTLPSYGAATHDVVLDMGPDLQCDDDRHPLESMREMDVTDQQRILPPSYLEASSSSPSPSSPPTQPPLPAQPPPAYDAVDRHEEQQQDQSTPTTPTATTTTTTVLPNSDTHNHTTTH
ncbi:hypothetical protein O0I10_010302 [Lichtheimia ornata]|uniref:Uncharacterized protein n=1 Tax=Lichtheimia ornata TaxID=688661 RepID=A0AAD7UW74_9FUNG|nr:uncharacterized protein O0I10_010302 [Lichtheimia ornata]KAJ8654091.1 hypothetical protein O0I10_010302 [Lichtheimia ornata]